MTSNLLNCTAEKGHLTYRQTGPCPYWPGVIVFHSIYALFEARRFQNFQKYKDGRLPLLLICSEVHAGMRWPHHSCQFRKWKALEFDLSALSV